MAIVKFVLAPIVLGIIYKRMIGREVPHQISKPQAVVPVVLGVISVITSFIMVMGFGMLLLAVGYSKDAQPMVVRSLVGAFFAAGFPEEIAKLIMMLITILIFRSKIRNVHRVLFDMSAVDFLLYQRLWTLGAE